MAYCWCMLRDVAKDSEILAIVQSRHIDEETARENSKRMLTKRAFLRHEITSCGRVEETVAFVESAEET